MKSDHFVVVIETQKNWEKRVGKKAYLARLSSSGREFAPRTVNENNRRCFAMPARPGDVFEARRGWWNGDRDSGGTVWFVIDGNGKIHSLTREEAIMAVTAAAALEAPERDQSLPTRTMVERFAPERVWCHAS